MAGNERWGAELSASHPLTANMTLTAQLGYNDDHIKRELAPPALAGFAPAEHPDNPFGQDVRVFSRIADGALRTTYDDTIERRGALGLEGFSGAWAWRSGTIRRASLPGMPTPAACPKIFRNCPFSALMRKAGPGPRR